MLGDHLVSIFESNNLSLSVTSASGIEAVTKRELITLGFDPSPAINGRTSFKGDMDSVAKCNVNLRTADRVYINLSEFDAESFDQLFESIYEIEWENILPINAKIIINAKSVSSTLFALSAIQSITKKAIIDRLKNKLKITTFFEDGAEYKLDVNFYKNHAIVTLDTSGNGLHKRGYRAEVGEAPLRETMAAAIIMLSNWKFDLPFIDPFCGSGTIPIEASLIATNTAPNLNRSFAFDTWKNSAVTSEKAKDEAKQLIIHDRNLRISGFDIDSKATKLAIRHAAAAGVSSLIHFQTADMRTISSRFQKGVIVTNPPYGERLMSETEVAALYRDFGKLYRSLDNWSLNAITSYGNFERVFGGRADKTRKLYNAQLECRLYQYFCKA
jgi:putative N6-adenine-specific DNA methylase